MKLKFTVFLIFLFCISNTLAQDTTKRFDNSDVIVYITKTGSKYHQSSCRYLSKSKIPRTLEKASQSYGACSVCLPPILSSTNIKKRIENPKKEITVYITRTGKKYHRGSCRYLKRSKISTSLNSAKKRFSPCKVCRPPT